MKQHTTSVIIREATCRSRHRRDSVYAMFHRFLCSLTYVVRSNHIIICLFILNFSFSFAQQNNGSALFTTKIDSLLSLLKTGKQDTNKVNHLNDLCREYKNIGSYDTALYYNNIALQLSQKINFHKGVANAYGGMGNVCGLKGDYPKALDYYFKALKIDEELNDKKGIAVRLGNIGNIYFSQGDFPKSLEYYFKALKTDEELPMGSGQVGNKNGISRHLGNIGGIYHTQGDYPKALDYYFKALKMDDELGNKRGMTYHLTNIGSVYNGQGDYPKALEYFFKASKTQEEIGDKIGVSANLCNIGNVYSNQGDYYKALDYYFKALKIQEEIGDKNGITINLGEIGSLYTTLKRFKEAEEYLLKALAIDTTIGFLDHTKHTHETLSDLYITKGEYKNAYEHYKQYTAAKDSLFNIEKEQDMTRKEMGYEYEKKEAATQAEHDKQAAVAEAESKRQRLFLWLVAAVAAAVAVIAFIIFRSLRVTKKQKKLIEEQKIVVEKQKHLVEEKQKEIIDSINYAKRLQEAILPPFDLIKKYLPESFILYKPKDIVAGDFYWMEVVKEEVIGKKEPSNKPNTVPITIGNRTPITIFLAACDSTGHGVPGAMLSVVCSNALNRAVKEFDLRDTGKILDKVTDLVLETFEMSGEEIKDGMDISLLRLKFNVQSLKLKEAQWSGANNPLWCIQNGELIEIKPNKQPIGKSDNRKPFTTHIINCEAETTFYLVTDGFQDQFGGQKEKKFMSKRFEKNLSAICHLPLNEQKETLQKAFDDWKGSLEQVDDVTVIGIRV